jgi:hypothetical protein
VLGIKKGFGAKIKNSFKKVLKIKKIYNSKDATEDSSQTLYGKHILRTNVNSSLDPYAKQNPHS